MAAKFQGHVLVCEDHAWKSDPVQVPRVYCGRQCWDLAHGEETTHGRARRVRFPVVGDRSARTLLKRAAYGLLTCALCGRRLAAVVSRPGRAGEGEGEGDGARAAVPLCR